MPSTRTGPTGKREAEGERFELSDDVAAVNGFRDRPVQPLRHPSERLMMIGTLEPDAGFEQRVDLFGRHRT